MSKKYKNAMNKITVDEQMKNRILNNINNCKEIEANKYLKSNNIKIVKHTYYRNLGVIAACCAVIICTLNNKYIINSYRLNTNSVQNTEIAFNGSENSNETSKSRERIEADYKTKIINENSQNNISKNEDNNIKEDETSMIEGKMSQYNGDKTAEASYAGRSTVKEFKTLDELRKSIDFTIKTPKVQSESNEIKSIIMDSNKNISIEYENKDYSLVFKIEKDVNEESLDNIQSEREKVINIGEKSILLKGNNNLINIASWREDNIYFEIESIMGIKEEKIINIIKSIE